MGTSSRLATMLDADMLLRHGVTIFPPNTPDDSLPVKFGSTVAEEIGDRYLMRYLLPTQLRDYLQGSTDREHYVTPTPYSPEETVRWLALPGANIQRAYVLLLKPGEIESIKGPRWVHMGGGIEYLLPKGFKRDAIVDIGTAMGSKWAIEVL